MSATVVEITNWARPQIGRKIHRVRSRTRIDTQLRKQGLIVGRGRKMRRVKPFVVTTDGKNYLLQSEWKRTLNRLIMENQSEINKLLISYNIPILDESNVPITAETLSKRP